MSNYSPAYPTNVQVDAGVKDFITKFYGVSDTPGKNQEWLDFFHDDATLVMALQEATGKTGEFFWPSGLLAIPERAADVEKRRHPQGARGHVGEGAGP